MTSKTSTTCTLLICLLLTTSCIDNTAYNGEYSSSGLSQQERAGTQVDSDLFKVIKTKDSLLFDIGFNNIDTLQVKALTSTTFEFYHDEHGITNSQGDFIRNINGIRDLPFKTWRVLDGSSMEVFPLYKNNSQELYGAIQNASHNFYQQIKGEEARKTNTARFTHLWLIEDGDWRLSRVLSYDHQVPSQDDNN